MEKQKRMVAAQGIIRLAGLLIKMGLPKTGGMLISVAGAVLLEAEEEAMHQLLKDFVTKRSPEMAKEHGIEPPCHEEIPTTKLPPSNRWN